MTQTLVPTLHHLVSSQSLRVLWALEELAETHGLVYKLETHARGANGGAEPGLQGLFPLGKSPILTVDEGGVRSQTVFQLPAYPGVLTESRLILQFLSDTYAEGAWVPHDEVDRRQDIFFQEFAQSTLALKVDFALIFDVIPPRLPTGLRQLVAAMVKPVMKHWMGDLAPIFQLLEHSLSDERPWFSGRALGLADFTMSWGMDVASQRGYFNAHRYPRVARWHTAVTQRPAYKRALDKGGSYNLDTFS
ncbi:hypothetical protein MSPP1_003768 [Malassezia sp. CBS 17886]|nr:hypothetical protein MSPP1_003768 [Malassezia sp. CBS 17886]